MIRQQTCLLPQDPTILLYSSCAVNIMALPIATIVDIVSMSLSFLITAMTAWEFYRRRTRKHRKSGEYDSITDTYPPTY